MEQRYANESSAQSSTVNTYFNADEAPSGKYLNQAEMTKQPSKVKPSFFLAEAFEIEGQGRRYRISPFVSAEQAKAIEAQSGIVLKTEGGKISSFLGGGAYGRVYVAEVVGTGQFCAVKIITGKLYESMHESEIQLKLTQGVDASQSQLMPLLDAVQVFEGEKLTCLYYVLPLAALGSAADLQKQLPTLENVELKRLLSGHIAKGLLLGLWQMHRLKIYHLDVKLANLLINLQGKILLADFGTSEQVEGEKPLLTPYKSPEGRFIGNGDSTYFPPERSFEAEKFDAIKADSYSAGAALWELVTGKIFEKGDEALKHEALQNPAPNSLADLAKRLLAQNPAERWTVEQALNHVVFQAPDLHDSETMAVVLDFLKRFVQQVQLKARDEKVSLSLNELSQSQTTQTSSILENKLKALQVPFEKRPDIQEQLKLFLPLQGSFAREAKEPEKDCFALTEKTEEFLNGQNVVLVLLADGGSGKSLFTQHLATELLKRANPNSNDKPWLLLYIALGGIQHPENLLQEGLGLSHEDLKALEKNYQLLLIADGYDEQSHWVNLYVQNQLHRYEMKVIITSRINALPPHYSPYFVPQVPGEKYPRGYQEIYVQPFNARQIESYIINYVAHQQEHLQVEVEANRLGKEWLEVVTYQTQVNNASGLKELIQTPLLCRLSLEALPELAKAQNNNSQTYCKITRAQIYEAFMTRWIEQQRIKHAQPPSLEQIFALGQRLALSLYQNNREVPLNVGIAQFQFNAKKGYYQQQSHTLDWFIQAKIERDCLPLQEVQKGQYKFTHFSLQEFLLARRLYQQLSYSQSLKDLDWNLLKLTSEEKDRPILYFLGNFADGNPLFTSQLFALIEQSKADKSQARAAANAISVLAASDVSLCGKNFQQIAVPQADLSGKVLWSCDFSKADLTEANLHKANLCHVGMKSTNLSKIHLGQLPLLKVHRGVRCCAYSRDGRYLAVAAGESILLYDALTHKELRQLRGHTKYVGTIDFDVSGSKLASGSESEVWIWDTTNGEALHRLQAHKGTVSTVAFDRDGKRLASGSREDIGEEQIICIWDVMSGKEVQQLRGHTTWVNSVAFDMSGEILASGSGYDLWIWDVASGKVLQRLHGSGENTVKSGIFDMNGEKLACASGKEVLIWDIASGKELQRLQGHEEAVICITFDVSGKRLVSGSYDKTVRIWDLASGKELQRLEGHEKEVMSVAFDIDGKRLVSGSLDQTVRIWEVAGGKELQQLEGHKDIVESVAFDANGGKLASGSYDKTLRIWETASGKELWRLQSEEAVWNAVFDVTGSRLAWTKGSEIQIWDVASGKELQRLQGHAKSVRSVTFNRSGEQLASGSDDQTVRIWDLASGKELQRLQAYGGVVLSVVFDSSGAKLASAGTCGTLQIWDVITGKELRQIRGQGTEFLMHVSFDESGKRLAAASDNKVVRIWDVAGGKQLQCLQGHTSKVTSVAFDVSGERLISGSLDQTVRIWDLNSGKCQLVINVNESVRDFCWLDGEKEKLAIGFGNAVGVFTIEQLETGLKAQAQWVVGVKQTLDFMQADVSGAIGLSAEQGELIKQLKAEGEPIVMQIAEQAQPVQKQPQAFSKPIPATNTPLSSFFVASNSSSGQLLQQWLQSMAAQGTWTVERNKQNLSIVFNPQQAKNFALVLTQLRSHLSQLPEWQKVVAHEQKDNTLLIRLQNEADAKDCEAKFKGVFGIEEYKFGESCAVS